MSVSALASIFDASLSPSAGVYTNATSEDFKLSLQRWSNLDLQTPGAIIRPATEVDVLEVVKQAVKDSVPFVPAAGGHSSWSTIGQDGFVLDLGLLKGITIDAAAETATVEAGVLTKDFMVALEAAGRVAPVPDNNGVGVVSFTLGGGRNPFLTTLGYASDSLVSARVITAAGELIDVSASSNPDLFWGLKGAGQFYGLATSITVKTYPFTTAGNPQGTAYIGNYVFPIQRLEEVAPALQTLLNDDKNNVEGQAMLVCPPPTFQPAVVISASYYGNPEQGPAAFAPITNLGPIVANASSVPFSHWYDSLDFVNTKGDFKRYHAAAGQQFSVEGFLKLRDLYLQLVSTNQDAGRSGVFYHWYTKAHKIPQGDSALGYPEHYQWLDLLSWYSNPASQQVVDKWEQDSFKALLPLEQYYFFGSNDRTAPIEQRFPRENIARLVELKKARDPKGVFTKQFLTPGQ